jgi:branched-chain amino acid transport system substrate-binding protein
MNVQATFLSTAIFLLGAVLPVDLAAQDKPGTGGTATEIKIGNIACSTGWAQGYGSITVAEAAYFEMVNDQGGVNGRKINFVSLDNGCDSRNAVALARQLVEKEGVLLLFSTMGTESNLAIRDYMNEKKVPQLFLQSSSAVFDDPAHFPWTMGFFMTYRAEGLAYAKYILENKPNARIAVLAANDDSGREYVSGLRDGLGTRASALIVKEASYNLSDSDLEPQLRALEESGADVFMNFSLGGFATQSIRKAFDLGWHPKQFISNASLSVAAFLEPAGLSKSSGVISNARSKSWQSARSKDDPDVRAFLDWMNKYNPHASLRDQNNVAGYERAEALVAVLKKCGDDLSRDNVMKQAASLDVELGMLRPGIRVTTRPTDYQPIKQFYLIQFNGKEWMPIGSPTSD